MCAPHRLIVPLPENLRGCFPLPLVSGRVLFRSGPITPPIDPTTAMDRPQSPAEKGSLAFFAAWLLLHEKADDWIRDAMRRARETPEELRHEYQEFLLAVEREKDALKGLLSEAFSNEIRQMGFFHRDDAASLQAQVDDLHRRLRGLEEKLERLTASGAE